jgi:phosphoribosylaminoimidazole-succinocarboxamide synthase
LFQRGTEIAASRGLILVDTKYEFGKKIVLFSDEILPRLFVIFYAEGYQERQDKGRSKSKSSKEFVRRWLIEKWFSRTRRASNT